VIGDRTRRLGELLALRCFESEPVVMAEVLARLWATRVNQPINSALTAAAPLARPSLTAKRQAPPDSEGTLNSSGECPQTESHDLGRLLAPTHQRCSLRLFEPRHDPAIETRRLQQDRGSRTRGQHRTRCRIALSPTSDSEGTKRHLVRARLAARRNRTHFTPPQNNWLAGRSSRLALSCPSARWF